MKLVPAALALAILLPATAGGQRFEPFETAGLRWYKGNTHTHTERSDGDSPPEVVVRWYRDHGYNFLVLSDHNVFTDPAQYRVLTDTAFILIPGEELTSAFGTRPVHVNGLNIPHLLEPQRDSTLVGTIQRNVDAVRNVSGVPHINHPNFGWAIDAQTLLRIERDRLVEIFNGHPHVHNAGGDDSPGMEAVWDYLLSRGKRIYGIAVDDAHHFQGEFGPQRANPGRGWLHVLAPALDAGALMSALESGRFYASTGVVLAEVEAKSQTLRIRVQPQAGFKYTTEFIGRDGVVLATTGGPEATYTLRGDELYVRAKVRDSGGFVAWTQPVFVQR